MPEDYKHEWEAQYLRRVTKAGAYLTTVARLDFSAGTKTFWCTHFDKVLGATDNFNTGVQDLNDATKVAETILRLEGII